MSAPTYDTRCFDAASGRELYTEAGFGPHGRVVRLIETAAHVITDATTQGERR